MAGEQRQIATRRLGAVLALGLVAGCAAIWRLPALGSAAASLSNGAALLAALSNGAAAGGLVAAVAGLVAPGEFTWATLVDIAAVVWLGVAARRRIPSFLAWLGYWLLVGLPALMFAQQGASAASLLGLDWGVALARPLSSLVGLAIAEVALASDRLRGWLASQAPYDGKRPLRALLMYGFVLLAVMPALLLGARVEATLDLERQERSGLELAVSARRLASAVDGFLERHRASLLALASETSVAAPVGELAPSLDHHRRLFPGFLTLLVADASGNILVTSPPLGGAAGAPATVRDRDYFQQTRASARSYVSGAFRGRGFGRDVIVAVTAPLPPGNQPFAGLIEGSLDLAVLRGLLLLERSPEECEHFLIDVGGRLVASSRLSLPPLSDMARVVAAPGAADAGRSWRLVTGEDDAAWLLAEAATAVGWRVVARRSLAVVRGQNRSLLLGSAGVATAVLGGIFLLALLSASTVSRPIEQLARDLASLDLDRPRPNLPSPRTPAREVDRLAKSIDALRERLGTSYTSLAEAIASREAANQELGRLVAHMDRLVRERTAELAEEKERAEHLARLKMEFLAHMSHEIRTPLNSVIGLTELLLQTPLAGVQQEYAETIRGSGESLLAVVNDVLDLSKIEQGKLEIESRPCDLEALLEEAVRAAAVRAAGKGVEVFCELARGVPPFVLADPLRLRQVLLNLLGNAVRLTEQGEVELLVNLDPKPGLLRVAVRDTGPGIPPELRVRLYQPYSQLGGASAGSTGLGLAISRALVERMGGEIWVDAGLRQGARFFFTFRAPVAPEPPSPPVAPPASLAGRTVLLVVRNDALRASLERRLTAWGGLVSGAVGMAAALELAGHTRCALALIDLDLDDGTGPELARRLVAEGRCGSPLLLAPMGRSLPRSVTDPFVGRLTKPVRTRDLAAGLAAAIARLPEAAAQRWLLVLSDSAIERRLLRSFAQRAGWRATAPEDWSQDPADGAPAAVVVAVEDAARREVELGRLAQTLPRDRLIGVVGAEEATCSLPVGRRLVRPIDAGRLAAILGEMGGREEVAS